MYTFTSSSSLSGSLSSHVESQNKELILQQLFKELFKFLKCYSSFSQMKSYCSLCVQIKNCLNRSFISFFLSLLFFFFFSFLCAPATTLFSIFSNRYRSHLGRGLPISSGLKVAILGLGWVFRSVSALSKRLTISAWPGLEQVVVCGVVFTMVMVESWQSVHDGGRLLMVVHGRERKFWGSDLDRS
jgi:hypothetical protein